MNEPPTDQPALKIVSFSIMPFAYAGVARWAAQRGHTINLLVTTPGPASRRNRAYLETIAGLPPRQEVIVTTRMTRLVPYIASLEPDIILSFTFPYRIPPELVKIPRYGAVNLHPTPLPKYRGPNPLRLFYDGETEFGATLHWIAPDFDTGNILSRKTITAAEDATFEELFDQLGQVAGAVIDEGVPKAVAGDPGLPQVHDESTYGARFSAQDLVLDLTRPIWLLRRQMAALQAGGQRAHVRIDGHFYPILGLEPAGEDSGPAPGEHISLSGQAAVVQTGSGPARLDLGGGLSDWPELQESPM
ncbi:methionyl-tRNA formyltransferase [soil metagenome]